MNLNKLQNFIIQDMEDRVISVGGLKYNRPKVKEITENGKRYKVYYTTEYIAGGHNELNYEIELYRKEIS